jgi:hypothetical protein
MKDKDIRFGIIVGLLAVAVLLLFGNVNAIQGDLDGDGYVQTQDLMTMNNLILGLPAYCYDNITNNCSIIADLDYDGFIQTQDLIILENIMNGFPAPIYYNWTERNITECQENGTLIIQIYEFNNQSINYTIQQNCTYTAPVVNNGGGSSGGGSSGGSSNYCDYEGTIHKSTYILCKCKNNHETCWRSTSSLDTSVSQKKAVITIEPINKTPKQEPVEERCYINYGTPDEKSYPIGSPECSLKKSYAWVWWIIGIIIVGILAYFGYIYYKETDEN